MRSDLHVFILFLLFVHFKYLPLYHTSLGYCLDWATGIDDVETKVFHAELKHVPNGTVYIV